MTGLLRWTGAQVVAVDPTTDTVTLSFGRGLDLPPERNRLWLPTIGTRMELAEVYRSPYWALLDDDDDSPSPRQP